MRDSNVCLFLSPRLWLPFLCVFNHPSWSWYQLLSPMDISSTVCAPDNQGHNLSLSGFVNKVIMILMLNSQSIFSSMWMFLTRSIFAWQRHPSSHHQSTNSSAGQWFVSTGAHRTTLMASSWHTLCTATMWRWQWLMSMVRCDKFLWNWQRRILWEHETLLSCLSMAMSVSHLMTIFIKARTSHSWQYFSGIHRLSS